MRTEDELKKFPWFTALLVTAMGLIFLVGLSNGPLDLVLAIGITPAANLRLEPWRLLTYGLVHLSPTHVLANGLILWLVGSTMERREGTLVVATVTVLGLSGSIAAIVAYGPALPEALLVFSRCWGVNFCLDSAPQFISRAGGSRS